MKFSHRGIARRGKMNDTVADEKHRIALASMNRYLAAKPLVTLVPGLDDRMKDWLSENGCERKRTIFLGTFVMFPDIRTQVALKVTFGVVAKSRDR
jgi:hypothetical protein